MSDEIKEYQLIEKFAPSKDYPMDIFWYGYWFEFTGKENDYKKLLPELRLKCLKYAYEKSSERNAIGIKSFEFIIKDESFKDALNNKMHRATVAVKWQE